MAANYYLKLTIHGSQRLADVQAGQSMSITHLVLGNANNQPYLPESRLNEIALVHEQARIPVSTVSVVDLNQAKVSVLIESNVGGFNIHEIGLLDETGKLVYIGNYHGGYKPILSEGAGGDIDLELMLKTNGIGTVLISIDASTVAASKSWANSQFVKIPTFDTHVTTNDDDHERLEGLITTAIGTAEEYAHNEDVAMARAFQDALDQLRRDLELPLHTTIINNNPVSSGFSYGTWAKDLKGVVPVGHNQDAADWRNSVGNQTGSLTHQLTIAQLPNHKFQYYKITNGATTGSPGDRMTAGDVGDYYLKGNSADTNSIGSDEPYSIVQPSQVVVFWTRTA